MIINIYICLRNNADTLHYTFDRLIELEKYHQLHYFIYENDSHDETKSMIKDFMKDRNGSYLLETLNVKHYGSESNLKRSQFLADCRNKMKLLGSKVESYVTVIVDSDIDFSPNDINTMIGKLDEPGIAMVTPFGHTEKSKYKYYDTYALLTLDDKRRIPVVGAPDIIYVKSAFGGIAVLKSDIFKECFWNNKQQVLMSEHYSFCKEVLKYGNIIILKKVKVGWNIFK